MKRVEEIKAKYEEMFGGFPSFLFMGADDGEIIEALEPCIESGKEYEAPDEDAVY